MRNEIEFRPIISGNLLRHPAFKKHGFALRRKNPRRDPT